MLLYRVDFEICPRAHGTPGFPGEICHIPGAARVQIAVHMAASDSISYMFSVASITAGGKMYTLNIVP